MKMTQIKTIALALAFAAVLSLAGCGQPGGTASSPAPESGNTEPASVPSSSQDLQEPSADEAETESAASEDRDESLSANEATAPEASTPESSASDISASEVSTPDAPEPAASESTASEPTAPEQVSDESQAASGEQANSGIDLTVRFGDDGAPFTLRLYDNETADAIARHVGTADWRLPIYHYDDYNNWEVMQYYDIPSRYEIPSNPQNVTSAKAGEVYYSEPNRIILFYGDAEISSEYTLVGYIDSTQDFVDAVESNPVLEGWGNKIVNISR